MYTSHNRALRVRGLTIVLCAIVACVSRFALVQTENQTVQSI